MSYFYVFVSHIFSLIIILLLAENNINIKLDDNFYIYKKIRNKIRNKIYQK